MKLLLITICLTSLLSLAAADPKVNLIFPGIIGATSITKTVNYDNYTLIIYTRAGQYKLVNFDLIKGTRGHIERIGDWKQPDLLNQDLFENENKIQRSNRLDKIEKALANFPKGVKYMVSPGAAMHNCEVQFRIGRYDLCTRKSHMLMVSVNSSFSTGILYLDQSTYAAPITAAFALPRSSDANNALLFDMISFDSTGRLFVSKCEKLSDNTIKHSLIGSLDLSSILNPLATSDAANSKPWSAQSYLMKDKPQLKDRLLANADTKLMGCYVESISPMYQRVEKGSILSPFTYAENSFENPLDYNPLPLEWRLQNQTALCLSRGLRMFEDPSSHLNIQCWVNGDPQNNLIDSIGISNTYSKFTPLAFQVTSDDKYRYIHLVYSLIDHSTTNYMFCKREGAVQPGKNLADNQIMVDWPENQTTKGCTRTIINNPPDDIVYLQTSKCSVHAAFYGSVYTISPYKSSMLEQASEPQLLRGITFNINAAFSKGPLIYFFTTSNLIVTVPYDLSDNCKTLSLATDSMKTMSSEQYVYQNFLKNYGVLGEPTFIDYREFEEGQNNTKPAIQVNSAPEPTLPPQSPSGPTKGSGGNGKLITIAVGIIIGGLIIAAVIYFLCLRGRDEDMPVKLQSRKSKRSPSVAPVSELVTKTVRSKYQSSTGGGSVVAAKSHKSRAMSPIKSSKSVKTITKTHKKSKNSKKSKLGPSKSSKTALNQSPATSKSAVGSKSPIANKSTVATAKKPSTPTPRSPLEVIVAGKKA